MPPIVLDSDGNFMGATEGLSDQDIMRQLPKSIWERIRKSRDTRAAAALHGSEGPLDEDGQPLSRWAQEWDNPWAVSRDNGASD
jgi:hypothetical protein